MFTNPKIAKPCNIRQSRNLRTKKKFRTKRLVIITRQKMMKPLSMINMGIKLLSIIKKIITIRKKKA